MKTKILLAVVMLGTALAVAAAQEPQKPAPTPPSYTLILAPATVDQIGAALQELPARIANPITNDIVAQIKAQNEAFAKAHAAGAPADATPLPTPKPEKKP